MLLNIDKNEKRAKFDALPSPEVSSVEVRNIPTTDSGNDITGMEKTVKEYQESTDENLVVFAQEIKNKALENPSKQEYPLGPVADSAVEDIGKLVGVDVSGYTHNIRGNTITHIENRHGENGEHDHSMADINDLGRIGYILENYDEVRLLREKNGNTVRSSEFLRSNGERAPLIIYKKQVNGNYYVVEAVPDTKAKKLQVISAYKAKV